jgi:hypothetical protein
MDESSQDPLFSKGDLVVTKTVGVRGMGVGIFLLEGGEDEFGIPRPNFLVEVIRTEKDLFTRNDNNRTSYDAEGCARDASRNDGSGLGDDDVVRMMDSPAQQKAA